MNANNWPQPLVTLRDAFAGQAMNALIIKHGYHPVDTEVISKEAYLMADDMMKARNNERT